MKISELIKDSAEMWPNGGFRMSPAGCGFLLAEMEGLVAKYKKELEDEKMSEGLRRMVVHHLEGLEYLTAEIEKGMTNK